MIIELVTHLAQFAVVMICGAVFLENQKLKEKLKGKKPEKIMKYMFVLSKHDKDNTDLKTMAMLDYIKAIELEGVTINIDLK